MVLLYLGRLGLRTEAELRIEDKCNLPEILDISFLARLTFESIFIRLGATAFTNSNLFTACILSVLAFYGDTQDRNNSLDCPER